MFLLSNKQGPIVTFSDESTARQWADKFGWTVQEVVTGDGREPTRMITGFLNLLEPAKPAVLQQEFVTFTPNDVENFLSVSRVKIGETFYRSNLENYHFTVKEGTDPNALALNFWTQLHEAGLDLERYSLDKFKIIKSASPKAVNMNVTEPTLSAAGPQKQSLDSGGPSNGVPVISSRTQVIG